MYCPSCGTEIPENSSFCLRCGKPINMPTMSSQAATEWDYEDFSCYEDITNKEMGIIGKGVSYTDIVQHTWSELRPLILEGVKEWMDDGWEPLTPIGPDCMQVGTQNAGLFGGVKVYLTGITIKMRRRRVSGSEQTKPQMSKKISYDVVMISCGKNKIEVIKIIMNNTSLKLVEAKTVSETSGKAIVSGVSKMKAESVANELRRVGAMVEIV